MAGSHSRGGTSPVSLSGCSTGFTSTRGHRCCTSSTAADGTSGQISACKCFSLAPLPAAMLPASEYPSGCGLQLLPAAAAAAAAALCCTGWGPSLSLSLANASSQLSAAAASCDAEGAEGPSDPAGSFTAAAAALCGGGGTPGSMCGSALSAASLHSALPPSRTTSKWGHTCASCLQPPAEMRPQPAGQSSTYTHIGKVQTCGSTPSEQHCLHTVQGLSVKQQGHNDSLAQGHRVQLMCGPLPVLCVLPPQPCAACSRAASQLLLARCLAVQAYLPT